MKPRVSQSYRGAWTQWPSYLEEEDDDVAKEVTRTGKEETCGNIHEKDEERSIRNMEKRLLLNEEKNNCPAVVVLEA